MSPEEPPRLWSTEQLADYLGVAVQTVHALRRRGEGPPAYRVGRVLRFEPSEVVAWLHELREDVPTNDSAEDEGVDGSRPVEAPDTARRLFESTGLSRRSD